MHALLTKMIMLQRKCRDFLMIGVFSKTISVKVMLLPTKKKETYHLARLSFVTKWQNKYMLSHCIKLKALDASMHSVSTCWYEHRNNYAAFM